MTVYVLFGVTVNGEWKFIDVFSTETALQTRMRLVQNNYESMKYIIRTAR